ncbi:MAG: peptide chain release factor N(5)-glutamine methyltransferase [Lachnospiraceae bacterium]|nr:peptide chain release factor N(5)-glutamine methyltransferase [Lachnospiraceae bacterium]
MTYSEALFEGKNRLMEAGVPDAGIDAGLLLGFVTGKDRVYITSRGGEELPSEKTEEYFSFVERRSSRMPLQYLTGRTEFMGLTFETSPGVLIPRLDTEYLVEEAIKIVEDGARVLDLCTGSGCILLSLMHYKNNIRGTGSDISEEALLLAKRNADRLGLSADFVKSDMFASLSGPFDYLIVNPPYIRTGDIESLMPEVKDHEPRTALDGSEDGLLFYRRIADEAKAYLSGEAWLLMETGFDQGEEVKALFEKAGYLEAEVIRDLSGKERVVKCLKN